MLSLAMGLRQSLGLFMPPLTRDTGISVSDFTLAIAVQNLAWGFLQPLAGAWATRLGMRRLMVGGALLYALGLVLLATASGLVAVMLGAGVAIGAALACNGSALALAAASRPVPVALRSTVLGIVSAAGSLGAMLAAPLGQLLTWKCRLARRRVGLRRAGPADGAGGLGGRQGRCAAACRQGGRRRQRPCGAERRHCATRCSWCWRSPTSSAACSWSS
jgi:MFS family permease